MTETSHPTRLTKVFRLVGVYLRRFNFALTVLAIFGFFSSLFYYFGTMRRDVIECGVRITKMLNTEYVDICGISGPNPYPYGLDYEKSVLVFTPVVGFLVAIVSCVAFILTQDRKWSERVLAVLWILTSAILFYLLGS